MKIEMTMNCGWEEMFEKLMTTKKVESMMVGVLWRIAARGDSMPRHDSPDPEEREYAEWVAEMRHGRQWAQRMDALMNEAAQQGVLLPLRLSDEVPADEEVDTEFVPQDDSELGSQIDLSDPTLGKTDEARDDDESNEIQLHELDDDMWQTILWEEYYYLGKRIDKRGSMPDPASEDELEREDALWLAQIEVDEANRELSRCEAVKNEVDQRQSPPLSPDPWQEALKARPFLRIVE